MSGSTTTTIFGRSKVATAELDAELVELDVLDTWVAGFTPSANGLSPELATAAMEVAVRSYSSEALDDDGHDALATVAAAAARYVERG
jgi:hypothetical protein